MTRPQLSESSRGWRLKGTGLRWPLCLGPPPPGPGWVWEPISTYTIKESRG